VNIEVVWEHGAEENISIRETGSKMRLKKIALIRCFIISLRQILLE
jgi:hypothetical protein